MSNTDSTIKDNNGDSLDIYNSDIDIIVDDYISTLRDKDIIYNTTGNCFTGLIKYLNKKLRFTRDIYDSIDTLNDIWDMYVELCYRFNQKPIIEEYALLTGINRDTIYSWMSGETRRDDYSEKLGSSRSDTIKKWQNECRMGRYKSAASGNVGGIFLCKAVDGMVETAPVQVVNQEQRKSIEQIAQEHSVNAGLEDKQSVIDAPVAEF